MSTIFQPPYCPTLQDAQISYYPNWLPNDKADYLLRLLIDQLQWEQSTIQLYGRSIPIPRLNAWYGDPDCFYTYSGQRFTPHPWLPALSETKDQLEAFTQHRFNSVLANYYRNGADSVSWHSDNEPELGENPTIASLSLGATRRLHFRHRHQRQQNFRLDLTAGSLLIMGGQTQHFWQHQISKSKRALSARINLTYRLIQFKEM